MPSLWNMFRLNRSAANVLPMVQTTLSGHVGIKSPWTTTQLSRVVLADIFGLENMPVSRAEAMTIPAIVKARHLICSPLARQPLRVFEGDALTAEQPRWLTRTDGQQPPQMRMLWTLDDILFTGFSLWAVKRTGGDGAIEDAARVPRETWTFDAEGFIEVDGQAVYDNQVILIPGPFEGLLATAETTIRAGRRLETAWTAKIESPIPAIDLHQTGEDELDEDEIEELIEAWATARSDPHGSIAYTPYNVEARALGTADPQLMIEGRNAYRLDVANFTGLPGSLLDGSTATASLTYSTTEGKRNEFADYSLSMWQMPIEARLSMDDVVPEGQRIAWDLENLTTTTQPSTGPSTED